MGSGLVSDEQRAGIVEAYQRGDKIRDIEQAFNVPRATVYWVLEQEGQTPNRIQRGRRLMADDQHVAQLYALIEAQDARIQTLEAQLRQLGVEPEPADE